MQRRLASIAAAMAAFVGLLAEPAAGQWPSYPAPGIPRLPDGTPNLTAPAPRTADGKPDLSGLWQVDGSSVLGGYARNVAQDLKPEDVQPWAQSIYQERLLSLGKDVPTGRCLPASLPSLNSFPPVFTKIIQTPGLVVLLYVGESNDHFRTIYTDGRSLPEDPNPTWLGYSVGHWEGDTLVVNTSGFNDRAWLDFNGHPQTPSLRITERLRRRDFGHMEFEMILDDPKVFTKPVSLSMPKLLAPDTEFAETICENEKDAGHLVGGNSFRLSPDSLLNYSGNYEVGPGRPATIAVADGLLLLQMGANGPKRVLVPQSEKIFMFRDNGDAVEFTKDAQGRITQFVLHAADNDQTAVHK